MASRKEHRRRKNRRISSNDKSFLSVSEISKRYKFHPNTVRAWVSRDGLRHVRRGPGGKIYIREGHVKKFIENWYEEV